MSVHSEKGHAKNVANFQNLITVCTNFGTMYNPSMERLTLVSLTDLYTRAAAAMEGVTNAEVTHKKSISDRVNYYKGLKKLSTRIVNAYAITDATDELLANARTINRKIQGKGLSNPTEPQPGEEAPRRISRSQQSFDYRVENFSKLVALVSSEPTYQPTEPELHPAGLAEFVTILRNVNTIIGDTFSRLNNARETRQVIMYTKNTGLKGIAMNVKKYVRSRFGTDSDQASQANKLLFRDLKE